MKNILACEPGGPGIGPHLLDATMFWNPSGGVRRYISAKRAWAQRNTNWRHTIASPIADELCALKVPSLPLPGSAGAYRVAVHHSACVRLMRQAEPDIIEAGDPYTLAWAALEASQAMGIPAVAFCHSNLQLLAAQAAGKYGHGLAERIARRYIVNLYGRFQLVLAPSRSMAMHLRDWGVPEAIHQPLGVDTAVFHPRQHNMTWRESLNLPQGARLLVYSGRFAAEKNLGVLVEAVHRLGPGHWLLLVGAGGARPSGERVIVLPQITDPARLATVLASADLFVHAGAQETFGLAALEAMACGLPVVARAAEGLAELVDASVGNAAQDGTPEKFAEVIADTLQRDRTPMSLAARARAEGYDWSRVMPQLFQHYRRVMAGAAPQASACPALQA